MHHPAQLHWLAVALLAQLAVAAPHALAQEEGRLAGLPFGRYSREMEGVMEVVETSVQWSNSFSLFHFKAEDDAYTRQLEDDQRQFLRSADEAIVRIEQQYFIALGQLVAHEERVGLLERAWRRDAILGIPAVRDIAPAAVRLWARDVLFDGNLAPSPELEASLRDHELQMLERLNQVRLLVLEKPRTNLGPAAQLARNGDCAAAQQMIEQALTARIEPERGMASIAHETLKVIRTQSASLPFQRRLRANREAMKALGAALPGPAVEDALLNLLGRAPLDADAQSALEPVCCRSQVAHLLAANHVALRNQRAAGSAGASR